MYVVVVPYTSSLVCCCAIYRSSPPSIFKDVGTYRIHERDSIYTIIEAGLKAGYRAFDTASVYGNEEHIGSALREFLPQFNLNRKDIFLTTKLAPKDHGAGNVETAVRSSLAKLGTEYLDLYLIHWPGAQGCNEDDPQNADIRAESWRELVRLHQDGVLLAIGVSNYTLRHLRELLDVFPDFSPAVNQVEFHPLWNQSTLLTFCRDNNILLQAYCSLGGSFDGTLLRHQIVVNVAENLQHSSAQVLLKWALQQGVGIIPKSVNPPRIAANIELDFTIPENDMQLLNNIQEQRKFAWDPTNVA